MILAGIDEAGLGPTLGPLATAAAALAVPDDGWTPESPWDRLDSAFCREWKKGERRAAVADSKLLYNTGGLAAFETTLGAFAALLANGNPVPETTVADDGQAALHPCYSRGIAPFPAYCAAEAIPAAAASLRDAFSRHGVRAAHLRLTALYEPLLNRRYDRGLNKNAALLVETGRHLAALAARFPGENLLVVVDKQGGRNSYLPFLTEVFPATWIDEMEVGRKSSRYRVRRDGGALDIRFLAKGDRVSFATALASLGAKYLRERAMAEMNAWYSARYEGLKKTAGYPEDARRWLADVRALGGDEHLPLLIRKR